MFQTKATIQTNGRLNDHHQRMVLKAPEIAAAIRPGQFVNVKVGMANNPVCRRPFTVFRTVLLEDSSLGIEIVYRVVGRGTGAMVDCHPGDVLDVIGPLGCGYRRAENAEVHILVGGGCGVAALFSLGQELSASEGQGNDLVTILGFRCEDDLILEDEFESLAGRTIVVTDDGSCGLKGNTVETLRDLVESEGLAGRCHVYASGPEPMNRALVEFCRESGIAGQLAMEKHMLCGIGGCFTCNCKVDKPGVLKHRDLAESHIQFDDSSDIGYAMVCQDGPVFYFDEVVFE